ncbi:MAG: GNAT family N-acetyltransferase [Bacteroidetes bacterium]|nr:GNAT family N-acetyltransferase [Bacteroidota bacterium]
MMHLSFRPATITEIPVIDQLAQKIWREHYPAIISVEQIEFMLLNRYSVKAIEESMKRGEKYFLAYVNDDIVAYSSIEWKNDFYYLHKFYLDVSKHRNGIGKQFFDYLLSQIDSSKTIKLQVNRTNYKAINFYLKLGFVIETVGDFDIGGGYFMNDFVMRRG